MSKKKVLVGVAWPYVNGDLHIGHLAGYLFPADIYARFNRFRGNDVLMVSGSDCFGTPITVEADKRGISPQALIEEYHPKTVALFDLLKLTFDNYTKTATPHHCKVTQDFLVAFIEKGLLVKNKTLQYFSPQENRFLPDRYVEGTCPFCGAVDARSDQCDSCASPIEEGKLIAPVSKNTRTPVELKETEHYFIDWPKIQPFLDKYFSERAAEWRPWIKSETAKWLKEGLQPRAITRDLEWGVEIPADRISKDNLIDNHQNKRIYVWFDAVIGYYSASLEWAEKAPNRDWRDFWLNDNTEHAYFMGKDNLVFHTLFWPGQLHVFNEKLHLPDLPAINQYLTFGGDKFSKSRGVSVDSREIVESYGLDAVRFYLVSISPENADTSFTWEDFATKTNSILNANIGNFFNRSLKLSENVDFTAGANIEEETREVIKSHLVKAANHFTRAENRDALETAISLSSLGNKYITAKAPWSIKDRASQEFRDTMGNCIAYIIGISVILNPILPDAISKLHQMLGISIEKWGEDTSVEILSLISKLRISNPAPVFTRVELKKG